LGASRGHLSDSVISLFTERNHLLIVRYLYTKLNALNYEEQGQDTPGRLITVLTVVSLLLLGHFEQEAHLVLSYYCHSTV